MLALLAEYVRPTYLHVRIVHDTIQECRPPPAAIFEAVVQLMTTVIRSTANAVDPLPPSLQSSLF